MADLYDRLDVISIYLPPLRERKGDIPLLVKTFIEEFCQENRKASKFISQDAQRALMKFDWPGNVRDLRNCIEGMVVMSNSRELDLADLPERVLKFTGIGTPIVFSAPTAVNADPAVDSDRRLNLKSECRWRKSKRKPYEQRSTTSEITEPRQPISWASTREPSLGKSRNTTCATINAAYRLRLIIPHTSDIRKRGVVCPRDRSRRTFVRVALRNRLGRCVDSGFRRYWRGNLLMDRKKAQPTHLRCPPRDPI